MARRTKKEREWLKDYAKTLFISEGLTAKEISARIDVSENTLSKWRQEDKWDKLRITLTQTREERLRDLYEQLTELDNAIKSKEEGKRYPDSKEADIKSKLTKAIGELEQETNIGEKIDAYTQLLKYWRTIDFEAAQNAALIVDEFIKKQL